MMNGALVIEDRVILFGNSALAPVEEFGFHFFGLQSSGERFDFFK